MSDSPDNKTIVAKPKTSSIAMIMTLGLVAMISGLLVVLTWQITLEPIKENKRILIEKAIFQVVPGAIYRQNYTITEHGLIRKDKTPGLDFYAAFDQQKQLKGIAIESSAQGYAGMVNLLYGYDPICQCIRGFSIIKMAETPGLGDRILTDKLFLANFKALDATVSPDSTSLNNEIITVKHASKKNAWEIDAISGATITSKAVGKAINNSAKIIIPKLQNFLDQIILDQIKLSSEKTPLSQE